MKTEQNHAISNAAAWLESINAMVAALNCDYARLDELRDVKNLTYGEMHPNDVRELAELEKIAGDCSDQDEAREAIQDSPLSVQVRSGWYSPGQPSNETPPEEFEILLSTGGPALRVIGELDQYKQPTSCLLQWQDWGTPWTDYANDCDENGLLEFCQQFYFGE